MEIKLYRVILNILFYIFYVLLASIAFSFIFPSILLILWQDVWSGNDPRFINIQFWILILVLVFSSIFRKYFYLPTRVKINVSKSEIKKEVNKKESRIEKKEVNKKLEKEEISEELELDIKIGKEIK